MLVLITAKQGHILGYNFFLIFNITHTQGNFPSKRKEGKHDKTATVTLQTNSRNNEQKEK